tara:strand:- start:857 stop:1591 length:735 start_codon:yes stop_codon:yes gene_type:complete
MKNKLAENLLRFGIKNLNESEVSKLQGLIKEDASSRKAFFDSLTKLDPKAAEVVAKETAGVTVGNKYVLSYVPSGEDQNDGGGTLYIYKVGASRGMPYIQYIGQAINRSGMSSSPDDIIMNMSSQFNIKDYSGGYNEVWNELDNEKTQDVIKGALQFIGNNQEKFKEAFHKFSRSPRSIDVYWDDNPQTVDRSQYGMWMNKYKDNALKVIDLVQDDELMYNIRFKVENFRSNGTYPELTIPPSI